MVKLTLKISETENGGIKLDLGREADEASPKMQEMVVSMLIHKQINELLDKIAAECTHSFSAKGPNAEKIIEEYDKKFKKGESQL
jgi:hypothetical protein